MDVRITKELTSYVKRGRNLLNKMAYKVHILIFPFNQL